MNVVQMNAEIVFVPNDVIEIALLPEPAPRQPRISAVKVHSLLERGHQSRNVCAPRLQKPVQMIVQNHVSGISNIKSFRDFAQYIDRAVFLPRRPQPWLTVAGNQSQKYSLVVSEMASKSRHGLIFSPGRIRGIRKKAESCSELTPILSRKNCRCRVRQA